MTRQCFAEFNRIVAALEEEYPAVAERFATGVQEAWRRLELLPGSGTPRPDIPGRDLRVIQIGSYFFVHREGANYVALLGFMHVRSDPRNARFPDEDDFS